MTTMTHRATVAAEGDRTIRVVREFSAPAALVFRAWTEPDLIRRWWHAKRGEVTHAEMDLRPGGHWRWAMSTPDGTEVAFHGEVLEVVPGERLVCTEAYEGMPEAQPSTNTLTLTEQDGATTLEIVIVHATAADRDGQLASGMEAGLQDALALLEDVAAAVG